MKQCNWKFSFVLAEAKPMPVCMNLCLYTQPSILQYIEIVPLFYYTQPSPTLLPLHPAVLETWRTEASMHMHDLCTNISRSLYALPLRASKISTSCSFSLYLVRSRSKWTSIISQFFDASCHTLCSRNDYSGWDNRFCDERGHHPIFPSTFTSSAQRLWLPIIITEDLLINHNFCVN